MYDETPNPPLIFGNHIISQFASHMLGDDMILEAKDFTSLRVVFRKLGGSWEQLANGDIDQMELLKKVVTSWGLMPNRRKKGDDLV